MDKVKIPRFTYCYNGGAPYLEDRVTGFIRNMTLSRYWGTKNNWETSYKWLKEKEGIFYGLALI